MASYTSSLRLTLPATGEFTGTWGTTVNTGITTLLDNAVAGASTIAMTAADYVLSTANGATDEARSMVLVLTGTPGAARNVICPAVSKLYVVYNNTTGGFAQTIKTLSGTGVSVPNGVTKFVRCDGTNVVEAFNSFGNLNYNSVSGYTGIGTLSPDMALDVTGASDSAINIRTNGALQVRNNFSNTRGHAFLSVNLADAMVGGNLRLDSTVTTGTHIGYANGTNTRGGSGILLTNPSADTDSGQVVFLRSDNTSLNDDNWVVNESGRFDADGKLLIGNSFAVNTRFGATSWAPALEVHGSTLATASIGQYGWNVNPYFMFSRSSSATPGNYAIATTTDLLGNISFAGADGAKFVTAATIRCQVGGAPALDSMPGELQFLTTPSGASTPSTRMVIDSTGDVQIATTTSGLGKLRVLDGSAQNIELTNTDSNATNKGGCITLSRHTNAETPFTLIRGSSTSTASAVEVGGGSTGSAPATEIRFYTSALSGAAGTGTERMRIDASGNVGIGTATPSVPLVVQATAAPTASFASTNDTSGPRVTFSHESPTPAANDVIAEIRFNGRDSALSADIFSAIYAEAKSITPAAQSGQLRVINYIAGTATSVFVLDAEGNAQLPAGALVVDAPTPASISGATTLSNANLQTQIINTTGTSYTLTMPLGTTLETLVPWFTTNLGFDFYIVNTASGTITLGANGNTTLGSLTIATGTSAQFRIRRTAANTFTIYRLG